MKRMVCLVALALLACFGMVSVCPAPVRADHGDQSKPAETRERIALVGAAIQGVTPEGHADFRSAGTQRQLEIEVERVNLADGTVLSVSINGVSAGTITLVSGRGELELNTKNGAVVPAIKAGDVVTITMGANTILSGTF